MRRVGVSLMTNAEELNADPCRSENRIGRRKDREGGKGGVPMRLGTLGECELGRELGFVMGTDCPIFSHVDPRP